MDVITLHYFAVSRIQAAHNLLPKHIHRYHFAYIRYRSRIPQPSFFTWRKGIYIYRVLVVARSLIAINHLRTDWCKGTDDRSLPPVYNDSICNRFARKYLFANAIMIVICAVSITRRNTRTLARFGVVKCLIATAANTFLILRKWTVRNRTARSIQSTLVSAHTFSENI